MYEIFLRKSSSHRGVEAFEGPAYDVAEHPVLSVRAAFDNVVEIANESGEDRHMRARLYFGVVLHILVKLWGNHSHILLIQQDKSGYK